jgi:MoaA/NifB/PqqE/SkfB family radical SAM enzyme
MTTEDWLRLVDQLPDYAWVTLTGGEPFVFKGFDEVFARVAARHRCNIITNGLLLDEGLIERLLDEPNFRTLSISIDDVGNTVRLVKPEQWRRAEDSIRRFARRKRERGADTVLDAKTVVLDDNAGDLLDIHKYCVEDLDCDTHCLQFLKGAPIQHADNMFPMEAMYQETQAHVYEHWDLICEQLDKIRRYNLEQGKVCYLHPKIADLNVDQPLDLPAMKIINRADHVAGDFHPCMAPWESVHINVDGVLFPCMAIDMGNVRAEGLEGVIQGERFRQFKEGIRSCGTAGGCNRCGYVRPKYLEGN